MVKYNTPYWAIIYVGLSFFSLFSGYIVYRSFLPSLKPSLGPIFISLNYLAYAFGSLLPAKYIANHRRLSFSVSSMTYPMWIICLQFYSGIDTPLYFNIISGFMSILNGFAAGVLWSTKGGWMTSLCLLSTENKSLYNGIFLSFYGLSGFLGNLGILFAVYFHLSLKVITIILSVSSAVGFILLVFTPHMYLHPSTLEITKIEKISNTIDKPKSNITMKIDDTMHTNTKITNTKNPQKWSRITGLKRLFTQTRFIWLILCICSLGSSATFVWVILPRLQTDLFNIAIAYSTYAIINGLGSFLGGKLMKRKPEIITILYVLNTLISISLLTSYAINPTLFYPLFSYSIIVGMFGLVISIYTAIIYAEITQNIVTELVNACPEVVINESISRRGNIRINPLETEPFAIQNLLYCLCYAILSSLVPMIDGVALTIIVVIFNMLGLVSVCIYRQKSTVTQSNEI